MPADTPPPRLTGLALRSMAAAASAPVVGDAIHRQVMRQMGVDVLEELDFGDPGPAPALPPRPARPGGA